MVRSTEGEGDRVAASILVAGQHPLPAAPSAQGHTSASTALGPGRAGPGPLSRLLAGLLLCRSAALVVLPDRALGRRGAALVVLPDRPLRRRSAALVGTCPTGPLDAEAPPWSYCPTGRWTPKRCPGRTARWGFWPPKRRPGRIARSGLWPPRRRPGRTARWGFWPPKRRPGGPARSDPWPPMRHPGWYCPMGLLAAEALPWSVLPNRTLLRLCQRRRSAERQRQCGNATDDLEAHVLVPSFVVIAVDRYAPDLSPLRYGDVLETLSWWASICCQSSHPCQSVSAGAGSLQRSPFIRLPPLTRFCRGVADRRRLGRHHRRSEEFRHVNPADIQGNPARGRTCRGPATPRGCRGHRRRRTGPASRPRAVSPAGCRFAR